MAIPETQLDTWSHQGAIQGSSSTYKTIKDALESERSAYDGKDYSVFLQGSYGNDTNIWAESDVDVVVCLNECFQSDKSKLPDAERQAWAQAYKDAAYAHVDFKRDVLARLKEAFGADAHEGKKAIMIEARGNRRKADVIPAVLYRRYYKFNGVSDQSYDEGICFYTSSGDQIANYPKQHRANLTKQHQASNSWLKPMVRIMKNLRSKLVDDEMIEQGVAPSYFIEGLLYNVPGENFHTSYGTCFVNAMNWLQQEADKDKLVCANEQYYLRWDGTPTSWPKADSEKFIDESINLWNHW